MVPLGRLWKLLIRSSSIHRIPLDDAPFFANELIEQGVKDPRGPVGMTATRKRGPRRSQPPLGGLTK
jgi:hypothetical protein